MNAPLKKVPHSAGYVQLYDEFGNWICTCHEDNAEVIEAALKKLAADLHATNDNCNDQPFR